MLATPIVWRSHRTMNQNSFRVVIVAGVVVVSILGVIAFAVVLSGELTDRSIVVLTAILGFLGPTIASLLVLLRVDATSAQTDRVQQKVEDVQEFVANGGLRENVKKAIIESESDPAIREQRIDNVAKGVSKDRHDTKNREAGAQARAQLEARRRKQEDRP